METPMPKKSKPRRKLSKILKKKSNTSLNSSSYNKLKSAINVSLNSSHRVRSLLSNNKALAAKHENLQVELRNLTAEYTSLQMMNQQLSERNMALERLLENGDPMILVEEEVNRRNDLLLSELKTHLNSMMSSMQGTMEHLFTISQLCSSRSSLGATSSRGSSRSTGSLCMAKSPGDDFSTVSTRSRTRQSATSKEILGDISSFPVSNEASPHEDFGVNEMSMIVEKSVLASPSCGKVTAAASDLGTISERKSDPEQAKEGSKLPMRVLRKSRSKQRIPTSSKEDSDQTVGESSQSALQNTFVVNKKGYPEFDLGDTPAPPNLISLSDEDDQVHPSSDPRAEEVVVDVDQLIEKNISTSKLLGAPNTKENTNLKLINAGKQNVRTKNIVTKEIKQKSTVKSKPKKSLCISNEFELLNAHKMMVEKTQTLESTVPQADSEPTADGGIPTENTIYDVVDMEFTAIDPWQSSSEKEPVDPPSNTNVETKKSRSREKTGESTACLIEQTDEKVPDAVTLRMNKPGKFVFAASRKEGDGSRRSIPAVQPRASSKSKKQIAEMIENLPQEEPKSIFDFHDKTPKLNPEKSKPPSIYSFAVDESVYSPPLPIGKASQSVLKSSVMTGRDKNEPTGSSALSCESSNSKPLNDNPKLSKEANEIKERGSRSKRRKRELSTRDSITDQNTATVEHEPIHSEPLRDSPKKCVEEDSVSKVTKSRKKSKSARKQSTKIDSAENTGLLDEHKKDDLESQQRTKTRSKQKSASCPVDDAVSTKTHNEASWRNDEESSNSCQQPVCNEGLNEPETGPVVSAHKLEQAVGPDTVHKAAQSRCGNSDTKLTILGDGFEYEEPLKGSPSCIKRSRTPRSRSKSRPRTEQDGSDQKNEEPLKASSPCSKRSRSKSRPRTEQDEPDQEYEEPLKASPSNSKRSKAHRSRSKSRPRTKPDEPDQLILKDGFDYEEPLKASPSSSKRSKVHRSRSKSRPRTKQDGPDQEYEEPLKASPSCSKRSRGHRSRSKSRPRAEQDGPDQEGPETISSVGRRSRHRSRKDSHTDGANLEDLAKRCPSRAFTLLGDDNVFTETARSTSADDFAIQPSGSKKETVSKSMSTGEIVGHHSLSESSLVTKRRSRSTGKSKSMTNCIGSEAEHIKQGLDQEIYHKENGVETTESNHVSSKTGAVKSKGRKPKSNYSDDSKLKEKNECLDSDSRKALQDEAKIPPMRDTYKSPSSRKSKGNAKSLLKDTEVQKKTDIETHMTDSDKIETHSDPKKCKGKMDEESSNKQSDVVENKNKTEDKNEDSSGKGTKKKKGPVKMQTKSCSVSLNTFESDSVEGSEREQRGEVSSTEMPEMSKACKMSFGDAMTKSDQSTSGSKSSKKRRAASTAVNYAEPKLGTKLRRGDPFTAAFHKVDVYKSPSSKAAKKNSELRRNILGPLHNLVGDLKTEKRSTKESELE